MCRECHTFPHQPGCPNAPEPEPERTCDWCGEPFFDEDGAGPVYYDLLGDMVCQDCIDRARHRL